MNLLIIYDIADDRRLRKIAKCLRAYGKRVQKSAFECAITEAAAIGLLRQLRQLSGPGDSIRGYRFHAVYEAAADRPPPKRAHAADRFFIF